MKNFLVFLFVLTLCLLNHISGGGVRIANELKFNKSLWMRCYSKDDVIGPKIIPIGQPYVYYFTINFFATTRFMCTLKQGPNYKHYQNFTAFKVISYKKNGGLWDWRAREDGVYLEKQDKDGSFVQDSVNPQKVYDWIN
ncbi:PREDICTED: pumilio homolog 15-like [Camelina sativa]|uniref:S-protein homolog n=1 Tax=Camelina sativa TaxID=90675 RepID=A0ABM0YIE7_CAMSA|nr:PREDICTED: pumilio homolog 15-like [Camelina sativa]